MLEHWELNLVLVLKTGAPKCGEGAKITAEVCMVSQSKVSEPTKHYQNLKQRLRSLLYLIICYLNKVTTSNNRKTKCGTCKELSSNCIHIYSKVRGINYT